MCDILWISTYTFLVAYAPKTDGTSDHAVVMLATGSKSGATSFVNYDELYMFNGNTERLNKYYMTLIPDWSVQMKNDFDKSMCDL